MCELIELFDIVPIDEGYHYLCQDEDGNYFEGNKADSDTSARLVFESKSLAQEYIDKYLNPKKYEPEFIFYNSKYAPKNIIRNV